MFKSKISYASKISGHNTYISQLNSYNLNKKLLTYVFSNSAPNGWLLSAKGKKNKTAMRTLMAE